MKTSVPPKNHGYNGMKETTDKDGIAFREIPYGSDLYEQSKIFREEILRRPLGLHLSADDIKGEESQFHFAAIKEPLDVVGTVLLKPLQNNNIKLRQMAVSPLVQGKSLGKRLVLLAEEFATKNGFRFIEMTARISAQGFYEKLGYRTAGDTFIDAIAPVPSIIMQKHL